MNIIETIVPISIDNLKNVFKVEKDVNKDILKNNFSNKLNNSGNIGLKTELSVVTKKAESIAYQLDFIQDEILLDTTINISGPNYNIPIKDETGPLTQYQNYSSITSTPLTGSLYQLMNQISASSIDINVDYTNYEDFIFFSSAYQRLYNFREKVTNISSSQAQLNALYNLTGSVTSSALVSSSKLLIEKQIETTITSFDGYES